MYIPSVWVPPSEPQRGKGAAGWREKAGFSPVPSPLRSSAMSELSPGPGCRCVVANSDFCGDWENAGWAQAMEPRSGLAGSVDKLRVSLEPTKLEILVSRGEI